MGLYLVCWDDEDGGNRDRFVACESVDKAAQLWREAYSGVGPDDEDYFVQPDGPTHVFEISPTAHLDYGALDWDSPAIIRHTLC